METYEYNCIGMVMDSSKNSRGLEEYHGTQGAVGWKLIDSYKSGEALGHETRMFTYIRKRDSGAFDPYFPAKVLFGISIACLALYGFLSFILRH